MRSYYEYLIKIIIMISIQTGGITAFIWYVAGYIKPFSDD